MSPLLSPTALLGGYTVASGTSTTLVREAVNSFTWDHHQVVPGAESLAAVVNGVRIDTLGLLYVQYGSPVQVIAPATGSRVVVNIPLGPMSVRGRSGKTDIRTTPFVLSAESPTIMTPDAHGGCIVGAVDLSELESALVDLTGSAGSLRFQEPEEPDQTTTGLTLVGQTWINVCQHLDALGPDRLGSPVQRLMAQMLISSLITGLPHSARSLLEIEQTDPGPSYVRKAIEYMDKHLDEPLSMVDIARGVNISVRQLSSAFRLHRDTSPAAQLRDMRLARAHRMLLNADGDEKVSNIAVACGFLHLGRFSSYYAERYGRLPSETLRDRDQSTPSIPPD